MPDVLAVNNYPTRERFERLVASLERTGAKVTSVGSDEAVPSRFKSFDGAVLSGSPDMLSSRKAQEKYAGEVDAIRDASVPVLGVCFGHQMMALAFGGQVVKDTRHVLGFVETTVVGSDPLFGGLERPVMLLESRWEVVKGLPKGFRLLATSDTSSIAAMRHHSRPLYGVQSHPERYTAQNPGGSTLIQNFVSLLER